MDTAYLFKDRKDAGRKLAERLIKYAGTTVIVFGLPRGGVPVAAEVARMLKMPLDVFMVRKLGLPGNEELALGAISAGGVRILNQDVIEMFDVPEPVIDQVTQKERRRLDDRQRVYRGERAFPDVEGKTVILVDDGLATGASMMAAVESVRHLKPGRIVVAVPVAPPSACKELAVRVDEIICLYTPPMFEAVGAWYEDFSQISDDEVRELIQRGNESGTEAG